MYLGEIQVKWHTQVVILEMGWVQCTPVPDIYRYGHIENWVIQSHHKWGKEPVK